MTKIELEDEVENSGEGVKSEDESVGEKKGKKSGDKLKVKNKPGRKRKVSPSRKSECVIEDFLIIAYETVEDLKVGCYM